jgi:hypothetical protein
MRLNVESAKIHITFIAGSRSCNHRKRNADPGILPCTGKTVPSPSAAPIRELWRPSQLAGANPHRCCKRRSAVRKTNPSTI